MISANLIAQSAADVWHIEINPESDRLLASNLSASVVSCPIIFCFTDHRALTFNYALALGNLTLRDRKAFRPREHEAETFKSDSED
jgi:hypothetical protein